MVHSRRFIVILVPVLASIFLSFFPLLPQIDRDEVVQTETRRIDHWHPAHFAGGQAEGALIIRDKGRSAALALGSAGSGAYTSPTIDLGIGASSVGVHWGEEQGRAGSIALAVRTSVDGLAWSDWQHVDAEGESAMAQGRQVFGSLVAAGGAHYAQYRISMSGDGPDLPAVHAVTVFGLNSATTPVRSEWRLVLAPRDRALATIKPLGIVSRKQWGADERLRFERKADAPRELLWPEEITPVEKIVVHHTAGPNVCASPELYCQRRSVVAINDIYYYHAVVNGWGDIGYNSLVGYDGRIYEGRHGPGPDDGEPLAEPVVAGHALRHNNRTHGIALMGDFSAEPVPALQYEALATMVGWIVKSRLAASGMVDPLGFTTYVRSDGQDSPPLPNIIGHRDVNATECPGDHLQARLIELRHLAQRLIEWPPVHVALRARLDGDTVAYHILVDNHEPGLVKRMIVKGAVPDNAMFVDSWAGSPYLNRGVFDGSVVTWYDPDAQLSPGQDRREYVFIIRPRPGVSRAEIRTTAWVRFSEPAPGIAMSEAVSADQPIDIIADPVAGGGITWTGEWPVSRNVAGYYGDAYQYHDPGDDAAYTWEVALLEPGRYEVFAWWSRAIDRATNALYVVHTADGPQVVRVNQRAEGARWVRLGVYLFAAGPARVTLGGDADGTVIADAVRFRQVQ